MADRSGGRPVPVAPVAPPQPWEEGWAPHDPWEAADVNPLAPTATDQAMSGGGLLAIRQYLQQAAAQRAEPWLTGLSYLDALDDPMRNNLALLQFLANEAQRSGQFPHVWSDQNVQGASGQSIAEALQQIYPGLDLQAAMNALAISANPTEATYQRMVENAAAGEPFQPVTSFGALGDIAMALATARLSPAGLLDDVVTLGFIPFSRLTRRVFPKAADVIETAGRAGTHRGTGGFLQLLEESGLPVRIARDYDAAGNWAAKLNHGDAAIEFRSRSLSDGPVIYVDWMENSGEIGSADFQGVFGPILDLADAAGVRVMAQVGSGTSRASPSRLASMYNRMGFVEYANNPSYIIREPVALDDAARKVEIEGRIDPTVEGVRVDERGTLQAPRGPNQSAPSASLLPGSQSVFAHPDYERYSVANTAATRGDIDTAFDRMSNVMEEEVRRGVLTPEQAADILDQQARRFEAVVAQSPMFVRDPDAYRARFQEELDHYRPRFQRSLADSLR